MIEDEDYQEIVRHFLSLVKKKDPAGYDKITEYFRQKDADSRQALLRLVSMYSEIGGMKSIVVHSRILYRLNKYIQTEKQKPIQGIHVTLSTKEQELYNTEFVDLTPKRDFSKFVDALHDLYNKLLMEEDQTDD